MKKHLYPSLLILAFSLLGLKALFHPGLFTAHDIWHQVARFYWFSKAFEDGQFPPYWIANLANENGYPLFFFSYPLPWIIGLFFLKAGVNIFDTIKILFFISYLLSGIFMYFLTYEFTKNKFAGLLSSLFYLWAPYHFLTIFVFGSIGYNFVFMFLPLFLLGVKRCSLKSLRDSLLFTCLGLTGMVLSHLITFISLIPVISALCLWQISDQKNIKRKGIFLVNLFWGTIIGLGISSFYLLVAIYYGNLIQAANGSFSKIYLNNFLLLKDVLYSKWNFGTTNFSIQLGIAHWLAILLGILFCIKSFAAQQMQKQKGLIFLLSVFLLNIFLPLSYSKPVWDYLTQFITLDFPSVFLLSATFISSFIPGILINQINKKRSFILFLFFVPLLFYANRNHLKVNAYTNFSLPDYIGAEITTNSYHEYFPKTASLKLIEIDQNYIVLPKDISVKDRYLNTKQLKFSISLPKDTQISIKQIAFPGMTLYVNNNKYDYALDNMGRISAFIPKGEHHIIVMFEETEAIKLAKLVTTVSFLVLFTIIVKKIRHEKHNKT